MSEGTARCARTALRRAGVEPPKLIAERPKASLREVAQLAGISPATVSDVRRRREAGETPVTEPDKPGDAGDATALPARSARRRAERRVHLVPTDPSSVLKKLLRDPSQRHKEEGRIVLRLLQPERGGHAAEVRADHRGTTALRPPGGGPARQYAVIRLEFAEKVDKQTQSTCRPAAGE